MEADTAAAEVVEAVTAEEVEDTLGAVVEAEVTLAVELVAAAVDTPAEALAEVAEDGPVVALVVEVAVRFMAHLSVVVLPLGCERLQVVCTQQAWHARHHSASRTVQVNFARHTDLAKLDLRAMLDPLDNFDRVAPMVPPERERARVLVTNPEASTPSIIRLLTTSTTILISIITRNITATGTGITLVTAGMVDIAAMEGTAGMVGTVVLVEA